MRPRAGPEFVDPNIEGRKKTGWERTVRQGTATERVVGVPNASEEVKRQERQSKSVALGTVLSFTEDTLFSIICRPPASRPLSSLARHWPMRHRCRYEAKHMLPTYMSQELSLNRNRGPCVATHWKFKRDIIGGQLLSSRSMNNFLDVS